MEIKLNDGQFEFITSEKMNTGFVAGLGSGKSYVATLKCIMKKIEFPELTVAYYLPNYGLIRDIAWDKFPTLLEEMGYIYKLNKSDKEIHIEGAGKIIFRSMDNPETIVGFEVFYSLIDECDILPMGKMTVAYNKILARNRQKADVPNQMDIVGTPEGFRFFYKRYVEDFNSDTDLLVRSSTYSNKHLPKEYIENLKQQYPPNLLSAYLNGEFINLASGTVYSYFNRDKHDTNREIQEGDVLHIGQDFNYGGCCSTVHIIEGDKTFRVAEHQSTDTAGVIEKLQRYYKNHTIVIYPDASGKSNKTNASKSDIQMLRSAGFEIDVPSKNGFVKDRVNALNLMLSQDRYFINVANCPKGTKALEQQAYNEAGEPEKHVGGGTADDMNDSCGYYVVRRFGINSNNVGAYKPNLI